MSFSSVNCAFTDLINFLEAIVIGGQECAFAWDAEGPNGLICWKSFGSKGEYFLSRDGGNSFEHSVRLDKHQLIESLNYHFLG